MSDEDFAKLLLKLADLKVRINANTVQLEKLTVTLEEHMRLAGTRSVWPARTIGVT